MPKTLSKELKQTGYNGECTMVGFCVNDLGMNQIAYTLIKNVNSWLEDNFGLNPSIFFIENNMTCLPVKFPRFHLKDANVFTGHLIATDIKTVINLSYVHRCKKYYYINDLFEIINAKNDSGIIDILKDKEIIKFCRSKDHREYLMKKGYLIHDIIVDDFDLNQILEIINDNKRT